MFTKYTKELINEGAGKAGESYVEDIFTPGSEIELTTQVRHLHPGTYTVVDYKDTGTEQTPSVFGGPRKSGPRKTDAILVLKQTGKPQNLYISIKQNNYKFIQNQITYPKIFNALKNYPNAPYVKALTRTVQKAVDVAKRSKHATYFDLDDSTPGKIIGIDINYKKSLTRKPSAKSFDYYLDPKVPDERFLIYSALTGEGVNPIEMQKVGYILLVDVGGRIDVEPNISQAGLLTQIQLMPTTQYIQKVAQEEKGNFTISFRHFKTKNQNASLENILGIDI